MAKTAYEQSMEIYNSIGYQRELKAKEKEVERLEKEAERKREHRFQAKMIIISAIVSALVSILFNYFLT